MQKTIVTCDTCKQEKDCENVLLSFSYQRNMRIFDICRDCCIKYGLLKNGDTPQYVSPRSISEQLVELLEEIARNAIDQ